MATMALFSASLLQIICGLLVYAALVVILIVISYIDWRSRRVPNQLIVALCVLRCGVLVIDGLVGDVSCAFDAFVSSLLVAGGSALLFILLKVALDAITHEESLGWGDVKLVFAGCLFLSFEQVLMTLVIASFAGILIALGFRVLCKDKTFPFAPALCLGIIAGLFT